MQLRDMRESFDEFHQHQYDDGGELGDDAYVAFKDWGRKNSDPIAINNLEMSEIDDDGDEEGDNQPPSKTIDDDGDDPATDDDEDADNNDVEEEPSPRHTGLQRDIPHGGFRGAD